MFLPLAPVESDKNDLNQLQDILQGSLRASSEQGACASGALVVVDRGEYQAHLGDIIIAKGTCSIRLPGAAIIKSEVKVKLRAGSGTVTLIPSNRDTIDGASSSTISAEQSVWLMCVARGEWVRL